nr:carbohydrate-binding domain-containing protein [Arthrobacter sp. ISL-72]
MSAQAQAGVLGAVRLLPPVGLEELNAEAALQTRVDRKYVVPETLAQELLAAFDAEVRVLEMDGSRCFAYDSVYFDTAQLDSYLLAALGRRRRYKVRTRTYVDSAISFLEVKTEGAREATVKERIPYEPTNRDRLTPEGLELCPRNPCRDRRRYACRPAGSRAGNPLPPHHALPASLGQRRPALQDLQIRHRHGRPVPGTSGQPLEPDLAQEAGPPPCRVTPASPIYLPRTSQKEHTMKSFRPYLSVTALALAVGLAGCSAAGTASTGTSITGASTSGTSTTSGTAEAVSLDTLAADTHYDADDLTWDAASEVAVTLADGASSVAAGTPSDAVKVDGDTVTISAAGTYRLSGSLSDGRVVVAAGEEDVVRIILDGAEVTSSTGSPFVVQSADEAIVFLNEGTSNALSDAATYADQGTDAANAALYSMADLT